MSEEYLSNIAKLIYKSKENRLDEDESELLKNWINNNEENKAFYEELMVGDQLNDNLQFFYKKVDKSRIVWKDIESKIIGTKKTKLLQFAKYVAAASVVIFMVFIFKTEITSVFNLKNTQYEPGANKGVLVLSDGRQIELNESRTSLIDLSGTNIVSERGVLQYTNTNPLVDSVSYNTLIVPKKGVYSVVLSDGSKVWLNSNSKLRFPTHFNNSKRIVHLEGEGCFEVKADSLKPFSVVVNNNYSVDAIGTTFNVNSYNQNIETTLSEGKVVVNSFDEIKILKPDQKAILNEKLIVLDVDNVEAAFSWKNGLFYFDNKPLDLILGDLARWYDVDYYIGDDVQIRRYSGTISKNVHLEEVVKMLSRATGLNYKLDNRVIKVHKE